MPRGSGLDPEPTMMQVDVLGSRVVIEGEIDLVSADDLYAVLVGGSECFVDLTHVSLIDSTAVRALLRAAESVGHLRVIAASRTVREMMAIGGCSHLLEPAPDPTAEPAA